jgi:hypothetical protein
MCPNNPGGMKKVLNNKSVQTTLGGMKENPQWLKVSKQSWGAWKSSKKIWAYLKNH